MTTASLRSPRLLLRELQPADASQEYVGWLADPEVNRYLETRFRTHHLPDIVEFIESARSSEVDFLFGIFVAQSGRHIGNIKVGPIRREHGLADVSLFIGARDCWGVGYAAEAIEAVSRYAFGQLGLEKLSASMYSSNEGSRQAFLKAGFKDEGLRRHHYELDGARCDLRELGLVPADLAGLR